VKCDKCVTRKAQRIQLSCSRQGVISELDLASVRPAATIAPLALGLALNALSNSTTAARSLHEEVHETGKARRSSAS
jgi:hypothetical protein